MSDATGMLVRLSDEMVRLQKEHFGKGPTQAKSYMVDDLLFIVMRGSMTTAEKTLLDFGHADEVRRFRQTFENEMVGRLTEAVEQITERTVLTYQSQVLFDPDVVVEIFVLDEEVPRAVEATARGQLTDDETGTASDDARVEAPSDGGR